MIFSSLFKKTPLWQHQDSTLRITAINNELAITDVKSRSILIDIMNEDNSDLVRRAALIKLHDFDVIVQAYDSNSSEKVRAFAEKQIEAILANAHAIKLTAEQKEKFLFNEQVNLSLVEHCLYHEQESNMIIALFEQINSRKSNHVNHKKNSNSHQLLLNTFTQKQDQLVQLHLLTKVSEVKLFEKLSKKVCNETVLITINTQLNDIHQRKQKPLILAQKAQLILSKLMALDDKLSYEVYANKKLLLAQEWQTIQADFSCLNIEQQQRLASKYTALSEQLTKTFASKIEAFEQKKIVKKLNDDKQQAKAAFSQTLQSQDQQLTNAVFENIALDDEAFMATLSSLSSQISRSVLNQQEQSLFIDKIKRLSEKFGQLGDIAESVTQATALISRISQLSLPDKLVDLNERSQLYNQWLIDWRTIEKKTNGLLPPSIKSAQQEIIQLWQSGLKSLQNEQKNIFFQQKKKLNDLKRLIEQGKYKVCFGLFSGVKRNFPLLSAAQQQPLQRDFDNINEKLAELSDWEHYIATPRKQELLIEIQTLITSPLDNPNEQASKVKQYRQTWNSFGHADDEVDKQLNQQFNQACTDAFAPCRLFYAEQDKLRSLHLANRDNIIGEARLLLTSLTEMQLNQSVDFKSLDGQLNKLQQQWQNAGEVDREHYKKYHITFRNILQPIKTAISNFHQTNVINKKALIEQAVLLKDSDNIHHAIDEIKKLQQAWREIGFAGNNQEAKLWKKFRATNDEIFAERQQVQDNQQQQQSKQAIVLTQQFSLLQQALTTATEDMEKSSVLKSLQQTSKALLTEVVNHRPVMNSLLSDIDDFIKVIEQQLRTADHEKEQQSWLILFGLLTDMANDDVTAEQLAVSAHYLALSKSWQKRLMENLALSQADLAAKRADKTLALEILAKVSSPHEFAEQRLVIQVQMLQNKMLSGNSDELDKTELNDALVDWLMLGKLSQEDLSLLLRVKTIYCR